MTPSYGLLEIATFLWVSKITVFVTSLTYAVVEGLLTKESQFILKRHSLIIP